MVKKCKNFFLSLLIGLVTTLFLLLLLAGCSDEEIIASTFQTNNTVSATSTVTAQPVIPITAKKTTEPANGSDKASKTESYLEGTYNCFAQGIASASGYANSYLFRPDGTWADITYGKQYASNPKYNFTYQLQNSDLTLVYPSGNASYKVLTENGKYKLVQYGDKNNQTCYQHVQ